MNLRILKITLAGLMMAASIQAAEKPKDPSSLVDFVVDAQAGAYDCQVLIAPLRTCIEKENMPTESIEALRKAFSRIYAATLNSKTQQCFKEVSLKTHSSFDFGAALNEGLQVEVGSTIARTNGEASDYPTVYVTAFRSKANGLKELPMIFAYSNFFKARTHTARQYISIGMNRDALELSSAGLTTNVEYLSGLMTLAIFKNMGIEESFIHLPEDPARQAAECVVFGGERPAAYDTFHQTLVKEEGSNHE